MIDQQVAWSLQRLNETMLEILKELKYLNNSKIKEVSNEVIDTDI